MSTDGTNLARGGAAGRARTAAGLAVAALAVAGAAAAHAQGTSVRPLFEDDTPLDLTIELPLRKLRRNTDDRPEVDSVLRHRDAAGNETVFNVEIRVRGKSRLEVFCDFPPLRVDLNQQDGEGHVFAGQNHLKLVTLCSRTNSAREDLSREYQIYRALNALSPHSFRVRWANVEYIDTDSRRRRSFVEPAFFVEEDWAVAERTGLQTVDTPSIDVADLDAPTSALFALFQFMIGNTDWSTNTAARDEEDCCHNGKPLGGAPGGIIVAPYDFDHSGLVNAAYAAPRSHLPIRNVRQRLYRGLCAVNGELEAAISQFNERRGEIEQAFASNADLIDERSRGRTLNYVAGFYEVINDPDEVRDEIVGKCRR